MLERLSPDHDTSGFDCGKPELNDYLQKHALDKQRAMLSRTYVLAQQGRVLAFYTLAHVMVSVDEAPRSMAQGMPRSIPALLLARLGVSKENHGKGWGRSLLTDALSRVWAAMQEGAAPVRLFLVDAMDEEAKAFYERFDMTPSNINPKRLFLSYKTLRTLFDERE